MKASIKMILTLGDNDFSIDDIVEVKYLDVVAISNITSFPINVKSVIGRICSLSDLTIQIDDSKKYYRSYKIIPIEDIIEINKISEEK